ncbi:MAG: arsenate reductase (glutaredoxin) [Alphaproteobacteria bacterium]|nr:arsenate reductase (glutaredoxin) [Alphaproteobacteria bacterium]
MKVWMTYNPNCGTARNVLALLRERGIEPEIRDYLKQPLSRAEIGALVGRIGVPVKELVRWKESAAVAASGITPEASDDVLLEALAAHPVLLNRPIVATDKGVRLCRPSETVLDLL